MKLGHDRILAELQAIIRHMPQKAATAQFLYDELINEGDPMSPKPRTAEHTHYAAVNDGAVWGIGGTEGEARDDASRWLLEAADPCDLDTLVYHPITPEEAEVVRSGDISWPIKIVKKRSRT